MMKNNKGFTLIELLVVIAIIGILAGILFVAINPKEQTDKSEDAKDKQTIQSIRTRTALVFSETGTYENVKSDENITKLYGSLRRTAYLHSTADKWVVICQLNFGPSTYRYFCADSKGYSGYVKNINPYPSTECGDKV